MKNSRFDILSRPLFILGLGLLLLNDFYLKYELSNFFTGKLSDIAGLFIFPYFLSIFKISWTRIIYILTALLFILWKSELSQDFIDWFRTIGIGVNRTVDYTDLYALIILPFSYSYFRTQIKTQTNIRKEISVTISIMSLFAFWATTLPRVEVKLNLPINKMYEIEVSKQYLFNSIHYGHGYSNDIQKNLEDSLFYIHFDIITGGYRADATALTTIKSIDSINTIIQLDTIINGYLTGGLFSGIDKDDIEHFKSISTREFEEYFEKNFIIPVRNNRYNNLYYDNKRIHDSYLKGYE